MKLNSSYRDLYYGGGSVILPVMDSGYTQPIAQGIHGWLENYAEEIRIRFSNAAFCETTEKWEIFDLPEVKMTAFEKATFEAVSTWSEEDILAFAKAFGISLPEVPASASFSLQKDSSGQGITS